ncbi:MAG: hypothetical protein K1X88_23230 [Nannocystaceae bacterium]|nr:hypothetical protein [Nannocystaceae bacterium]
MSSRHRPLILGLGLSLFGCTDDDSDASSGSAASFGSDAGEEAGTSAADDAGSSGSDPSASASTTAATTASTTANTSDPSTTDPGTTGAGESSGGDTGAHVPGGVLFFDDFEYDVGHDDAGKFEPGAPFVNAGWSWGKDAIEGGTGAGGWLYTADAIPGFEGAMPGVGSSRVLCVQSGAGSYAGVIDGAWRQTDFYLQYGDPQEGSLETIPADVWFQQWIYIADTPDQPSLFPPTTRAGKWIYPTRNAYPSTDLEWLMSISGVLVDSETQSMGSSNEIDVGKKSLGFHFNLTDDDNDLYLDDRPYATGELGHSGAGDEHLQMLDVNHWWLMRMHVDHTGDVGVAQVSVRPYGGDWIDLVDTTSSAAVQWHPISHEGHRGLRFPTTINNYYQDPADMTTEGDWWIYIDDFAIAAGVNAGGNGVDDLPQYDDCGGC